MRNIDLLKRSLLFCSVVLLAACSGLSDMKNDLSERVFGREMTDPPEELTEFKETAKAAILWQTNIGSAGDFDFTPAVEAGYAYLASADGDISKLDVVNGNTSWRIQVGEKLSGGVGVGGSLVIVGTNRGALYAYDIAGKLQWKSKLSSEILSAPKYYDGLVVVRTGDSRIYGINASDGSRKWVYDRTGPTLALRSSAGVVVDGGAVYAGFAGGKLVSIRADNGKIMWKLRLRNQKGLPKLSALLILPVCHLWMVL